MSSEFLSKVKALQIQIQWEYDQYKSGFRTSREEQAMQYSQKTASFLKETREQEAFNVSEEQQEP